MKFVVLEKEHEVYLEVLIGCCAANSQSDANPNLGIKSEEQAIEFRSTEIFPNQRVNSPISNWNKLVLHFDTALRLLSSSNHLLDKLNIWQQAFQEYSVNFLRILNNRCISL